MKKYPVVALGLLLSTAVLTFPGTASGAELPSPPIQAADYTGIYALNPGARLTVIVDGNGQLQARLTSHPFFPIAATGHDQFAMGGGVIVLRFGRSSAGRVNSVILEQHGAAVTAARTDDPVPTVIFLPAAKLAEYVGRYPMTKGKQAGADCLITIKNGWLFTQIGPTAAGAPAQRAFPLFADGPDHFALDVVPASVSFERDPAGVVIGLTIHQNGGDNHLNKAP